MCASLARLKPPSWKSRLFRLRWAGRCRTTTWCSYCCCRPPKQTHDNVVYAACMYPACPSVCRGYVVAIQWLPFFLPVNLFSFVKKKKKVPCRYKVLYFLVWLSHQCPVHTCTCCLHDQPAFIILPASLYAGGAHHTAAPLIRRTASRELRRRQENMSMEPGERGLLLWVLVTVPIMCMYLFNFNEESLLSSVR